MKKPEVLAVIPARYGSRRFPGKALVTIGGKSLLERLYGTVSLSRGIDRTVVATDSDEIFSYCKLAGLDVLRTSGKHRTGSDRSAEAAMKLGGDIIISVQADHWGERQAEFSRVIMAMKADKNIEYATFVRKIEREEDLYDPNRVKVVFDRDDFALWFSRYPLPFLQGVNGNRIRAFDYHYHIGVYFFRRSGLMSFHRLPQSRLEKAESLEQLRILEAGGRIKVFKIKSPIVSIDTREDLKRLKKSNL